VVGNPFHGNDTEGRSIRAGRAFDEVPFVSGASAERRAFLDLFLEGALDFSA
jgi:hypothetical protein